MDVKSGETESRSLLVECLCRLTDISSRRAWLTTWLVLLSCVGCISYTVYNLKFKTDRADLIDPAATFQ